MFVGYGIETFYDAPEYEDFCDEFPRPIILEKGNITELEQQQIKQNECREEYNAATEPYNRDVFIIALIAGTIAIILGGVVLSLESVSSGIMGGGVLTVIYGTMIYWERCQNTSDSLY